MLREPLRGKLFHLSCLSTRPTFCFTLGIVIYTNLSTTFSNLPTKTLNLSGDIERLRVWYSERKWTIYDEPFIGIQRISCSVYNNCNKLCTDYIYTVCSSPRSSDSDLQYVHNLVMSCPRDISCKTRSSTGSWSANCRGRLGFLFTHTQNCCVCPSSRVESYYFGGAKKAGQTRLAGLEKLRLHDEKKVSLTRLAGSTRELGERVNTVIVEAPSKNCLNFDVCVVGWCSD